MNMNEPSEIAIGTGVTWMETRQSGMSFNFSQKEGKLVEIKGGWGTVRYRNGRKTLVAMAKLEVAGKGKGELTRLVEGLAGE